MKRQLLLASAVLSVLAMSSTATAQGRIKCVDTPIGVDGDPEPDTYCPEDYGTDPRFGGARSETPDLLDALVAEVEAAEPASTR